MIGIISAMEIEAKMLKGALHHAERSEISGMEFMKGVLCGQDVVVAVSGVGKVFAAICAQTMILQYHPHMLINTGVAGTLSDTLHIGDIVVADTVLQHDMDTSPVGDPVGSISGINMIHLPCSKALNEALLESIAKVGGVQAQVGAIASGDQFIVDPMRKQFIRDTFGAIACEMEGAAIGQVCYVNNVPFSVMRAISDGADESSHMDYHTFVQKAAENSALALEQFLQLYW